MTAESLEYCLEFLQAMPAGANQDAHWRTLRKLYALILLPMKDAIGRESCEWAVLHEEWRPAPAKLRRIAARIASSCPDADEVYAEIIHKAQVIGLFGRPDPNNPNIFLEGPPDMSHPIVAQIVAQCGGWEMICTGAANYQEGLRKQICSVYEGVSDRWYEEVGAQLALPPAEQTPGLLASYARYALPAWYVPGVTDPPIVESSQRRDALEEGSMPDYVRRLAQQRALQPDPPSIGERTPGAKFRSDSSGAKFRSDSSGAFSGATNDPEARRAALDELMRHREKRESPPRIAP